MLAFDVSRLKPKEGAEQQWLCTAHYQELGRETTRTDGRGVEANKVSFHWIFCGSGLAVCVELYLFVHLHTPLSPSFGDAAAGWLLALCSTRPSSALPAVWFWCLVVVWAVFS